jgi:secreted PhoX family phosphatase
MSQNIDDDTDVNKSGNRPFADVLQAATSRRTVLVGGLAAAAAGFIGPSVAMANVGGKTVSGSRLMSFRPVPNAEGGGPTPSISRDYKYDVLIPWGSPIQPGGPEYTGDPNTRPTAAEQAEMIGIGHDGMWFFGTPWEGGISSRHGVLCINHEFGVNTHVLGKEMPESLEDVRLSQHAHGVSVVTIGYRDGKWQVLASDLNRRIHVNTPVSFSGPVAGHELLMTPNGNIPLGTVNNCASGCTPWDTYLTCEENFNGYFGATHQESSWTPTPEQERYGFSETGFDYGWEKFDRRFDLSDKDYKNEENRFGWVVEIDPQDCKDTPVKRTALGRFKHEGATVVTGKDGKAVVYMGDDERFDYIYKFVSADSWQAMRARGESPLDEGTLYVARFNEDGTGDWLPLTMDNPDLAARFADQAEILTFARIAADIAGATPMDRPEWITVAKNGDVYCTLTNNSNREVADAANPLAPNNDGHIIRWRDSEQFTGTSFTWDIFLIAETTHGTEDSFSDPDGIWADPDGRLFIETDGGQKDGLNNQLLVADTNTGELRRLLTGVTDDEITGLTVTPNRRWLFCNTQHPGDGDPTVTNFPAPTDGVTVPRDCTLVIRRKDAGIVGS